MANGELIDNDKLYIGQDIDIYRGRIWYNSDSQIIKVESPENGNLCLLKNLPLPLHKLKGE